MVIYKNCFVYSKLSSLYCIHNVFSAVILSMTKVNIQPGLELFRRAHSFNNI